MNRWYGEVVRDNVPVIHLMREMKTMKFTQRMMLLLAFLLSAQAAHAGPPTDSMKARISEVRSLLSQKVVAGTPDAVKVDSALRGVIEPVLDFERMSENALRAHWAGLSEAQRSEFVRLFRALLFRTYLQRIRNAEEDYSLEFESEEAKSRKAAAVTVIAQTRKAEIELVFHLTTNNGRVWIAEDVVIDEVSLVENYREQFNRIIKKDGYVTLLQKMADKLIELGGQIPEGVTSVKASQKTDAHQPAVQSANQRSGGAQGDVKKTDSSPVSGQKPEKQ